MSKIIYSATRNDLENLKSQIAIHQNLPDLKKILNHSFQMASRFGHLDVVKYFVNEQKLNPTLALQDASSMGRLEIVKFLIGKSADPNYQGNASLIYACENEHAEVVQLLVNMPGENWTKTLTRCMDHAFYLRNWDIIDILIEGGCTPPYPTYVGRKPVSKQKIMGVQK